MPAESGMDGGKCHLGTPNADILQSSTLQATQWVAGKVVCMIPTTWGGSSSSSLIASYISEVA